MSGDPTPLPWVRRRPRVAGSDRYVLGFIAFCLAMFAALLPFSLSGGWAIVRDVVFYNGVTTGAAIITWRAARRERSSRAWRYMSLALAATVVSDVCFSFFVLNSEGAIMGGFAYTDIGYSIFYPLVNMLVLALLRARMPMWRPSFVIDGLAAALLTAAMALTFVFRPIVDRLGPDDTSIVAVLAWPIWDVALVVLLLCGALAVATGLDRQLCVLLSGLLVLTVADVWFALLVNAGTYRESGLVNLLWPVTFVLFALASKIPARPLPIYADTLDVRPWVYIVLPMSLGVIGVTLLSPFTGDRLGTLSRWFVVVTLCLAMLRVTLTFLDLWSLKEVRRQALTDELTGLRNRRALAEEGALLFGAEGLEGSDDDALAQPVTLMMLDLDGFKEINDTLGHAAGDLLLVELASRLAGAARSSADVLARLGGDEFALLLPGTSAKEACSIALRLREVVSHSVLIGDAQVYVSGSFGVAVAPDHGSDLATLMRLADIAMYRAKEDPVGVVVYDPSVRDMSGEERRRRVGELRRAFERDEFVVFYQPKIDLRTHATLGVEALVRWDRPGEGLVAPDAFLTLVEESGLMPQLTTRVLEKAVRQAAVWRGEGRDLSMAVNLAPSAVVDGSLPGRVREILLEADLPPDHLVLEITEETLLDDRQRARAVLAEIRAMGVGISIDDFGSGYSSLSYLRELPVHEIKLDRSFVQPMTRDGRAASIVRAAIELAHSLSMTIVAEGVEDPDAARQLVSYGCDVAQGFHYARPQPSHELEQWFRREDVSPVPDSVPPSQEVSAT